MLGPDRFAFETPNIIDPGDAPPQAPRRVEDEKKEDQYQRERAHRLLQDIADLELRPKDDTAQEDAYDPYDEDDDEEDAGTHPREYAAQLLTRERIPLSSLGRTERIMDTTATPTNHQRLRYLQSKVFCTRKGRMGLIVAATLVVFLIVLLATGNSSGNGDSTIPDNAFAVQSTRHYDIVEFLVANKVSTRQALLTQDTPQQLAAAWIADQDELQVELPTNLYADYHFVQRYVLAVLFFATDGGNWQTGAHFVTYLHECSWYTGAIFDQFIGQEYAVGVTCDDNLQVRDVFLPAQKMKGSLPVTELLHLPELRIFSVADNDLTGTIPSDVGKWKSLLYFDIKYNQFRGSIPESFPSQLEVLGLSNNQLTGSIPTKLPDRLKTLAADDNGLTGNLDFMTRLTNLEYLYLDRNQLTGSVPATAQLPRLHELDLSHNQLAGTAVPFLQDDLPATMHVLDLSYNSLTATLPDTADRTFGSLDYLSLRGNQLRGSVPDSLMTSLPGLQHLDLQENKLTGMIPTTLDKMTMLRYLALGYNEWTPDSLPPSLIALSNLQELQLPATQLTGPLPAWLGTYLTQLEALELQENQLRSAIPATLWSLPTLRYLWLHDNQLTGMIPANTNNNNTKYALTLHRNPNLQGGDISPAVCPFTDDTVVVSTDCSAVECSCCMECCAPQKDTCALDEVIDENLENGGELLWELGFQRAPFAFDPEILDEVGLFQIIYQETP